MRLILPDVTLSYAQYLFKPQPPMGMSEADAIARNVAMKYSVALVMLPGFDTAPIKAAMQALVAEKFPGKATEILQRIADPEQINWKQPLRFDRNGDKYAAGSYFMNARNSKQPSFVHLHADPTPRPDGTLKPKVMTIAEAEREMYSGAVCNASVTLFWYDQAGSKGIGVAINGLQKVRDGARLDGSVDAQDEFSAIAAPTANVAAPTTAPSAFDPFA